MVLLNIEDKFDRNLGGYINVSQKKLQKFNVKIYRVFLLKNTIFMPNFGMISEKNYSNTPLHSMNNIYILQFSFFLYGA